MSSLPFYHIDVFTQVPYQGNPASVLVGSTAFDDRQMQMIAREIGLPGNGFVWPAPGKRQAFHIRFFTPQQEVSLSGHTSLACAHAILSTMSPGVLPAAVTLRTRTALLTVQWQDRRLWLTLPLPSLRSYAVWSRRPEGSATLPLPDAAHARRCGMADVHPKSRRVSVRRQTS